MTTNLKLKDKNYKKIRKLNFQDIYAGNENALPFINESSSKQLIALEIFYNLAKGTSSILKNVLDNSINNPKNRAELADNTNADLVNIKFNIETEEEIDKCIDFCKEITKKIQKPLILTGADKKNIDKILIPKLAKAAQKQCTIGVIEEDIYKDVIDSIKDTNHNIIARSPIDINLAKQINILLTEAGIAADRIITDPNIGGLGYGLDYAYSIIERIKLAGLEGDEMLNMPIIAFVGEESWKTKEARAESADPGWGKMETRAVNWELLTACSMITAGANIVSVLHPDTVDYLKEFILSQKYFSDYSIM